MGYTLGFDDLLNIPTAGLYGGVKAATGGRSLVGRAGDAVDDFMNQGQNNFQATPYEVPEVNYGGQYGADGLANKAFGGMGSTAAGGAWAQGQAQGFRGPQAREDQTLSDLEAQSRGYDQAGALQLAREGAMGMGPSQAAYQLQSGLDKSLAQQQAISGGARGAAGIALAGANANASSAALQNQAFNQAAQLRAQEMQNYQQLYGGLAGQQRSQDQNRLQMGNQMSQYNAGLNDQYRMGMGQLANQYNQSGLGWFNAGKGVYDSAADTELKRQQLQADSYNQAQAINSGTAQQRADARQARNDRYVSWVSNGIQFGGGLANGQGGKT